MEDENGEPISADEGTQIRSLARAIFNQIALKNPKCLPKSWGYAGLELEREAISELTRKFPKFRLCSGDWKAKHFLSEFYSDWYKSHRKIIHGIKEEDIEDSESETANVPRKRKPDTQASSSRKKSRISSLDNVQSTNGDIGSSDRDQQSESEASELRGRPKERRKVSEVLTLSFLSLTFVVQNTNSAATRNPL